MVPSKRKMGGKAEPVLIVKRKTIFAPVCLSFYPSISFLFLDKDFMSIPDCTK